MRRKNKATGPKRKTAAKRSPKTRTKNRSIRSSDARAGRPAEIHYLVGATGTGKTYQLLKLLERSDRAMVMDYKREFTGGTIYTHHRDAMRGLQRDPGPWIFQPSFDDAARATQFDYWCRAAWAMQADPAAPELIFAVDELQQFTRASRIPPAWQRIVQVGRARGFIVVGCTPAPAYVDTAFRSAATRIRCGRLGDPNHARAMASCLGVRADELMGLPDRAAYEKSPGDWAVLDKP